MFTERSDDAILCYTVEYVDYMIDDNQHYCYPANIIQVHLPHISTTFAKYFNIFLNHKKVSSTCLPSEAYMFCYFLLNLVALLGQKNDCFNMPTPAEHVAGSDSLKLIAATS